MDDQIQEELKKGFTSKKLTPPGYRGFRTASAVSAHHRQIMPVGELFLVRQAAHVSNRCKSGVRPVVGRT